MEYLAVAMVAASLAAWDFGRRWVEREHDAVAISDKSREAAESAEVLACENTSTLNAHATELTKLRDELEALEKRQSETARSLSITRENASQAKARSPIGRLSGARR